MRSPRLTSLSLDDLVALRGKLDKVINKRVATESQLYRRKIAELSAFGGDIGDSKKAKGRKSTNGRKKGRRKAAIKYRGPNGEKWSGRGMTPKWMKPLLKGGKKKEHFLVQK